MQQNIKSCIFGIDMNKLEYYNKINIKVMTLIFLYLIPINATIYNKLHL